MGMFCSNFAPSCLLSSLDVVYHGALRFTTDCKSSAHHCVLYNRVDMVFIEYSKSMETMAMNCKWFLMLYILFVLCCVLFLAGDVNNKNEKANIKKIYIEMNCLRT